MSLWRLSWRVAVAALALGGTARAEERPVLLRLAPEASAREVERTRELELRLARMLTGWPEVERAEVLLQLPRVVEQPLDRPVAAPSASVVLTHRALGVRQTNATRPSDDEVFQLVHAAVPALAASALTVLRHRAARVDKAPRLVRVGPFEVSEGTAGRLRLALGFSLAMHALFAGIVLWRLPPNRPAARKVDPRARRPSPP